MTGITNRKVRIGIVGAGVISEIYLKNLTSMFPNTEVVGIADIMTDRAESRAKSFGVEAFTVDELVVHPDVDIVVNLTIPAAHASVAMQAIGAGKSAYNEKPLAINRQDGRTLLDAAGAKGVLVGSAPDTFLGGGYQSVRKYLDDGLIGKPVAFYAAMQGHGMEAWHPDPYFFFQPGAGPLFDVGVYYIQALVSLLGPVNRVAGVGGISFPERTVGNGPRLGEKIPVNTPTHIASAVEFESGVTGTLTASFDVYETNTAALVIYGTEGTLRCPDPNAFGGTLNVLKGGEKNWQDLPLVYGNTENSRGLGVWDMATSLQTGSAARANGELGYHVLDIMASVLDSIENDKHIRVESTVQRPDPLPQS